MPSPFPGMDPFIEAGGFWPDFHAGFITYMREWLVEALPDDYDVRIDERINFIHVEDDRLQRFKPDLAVSVNETRLQRASVSPGAATLEPIVLPETVEEEIREVYIQIIKRSEQRLVTIVELLSPTNKSEPTRGQFLAKRMSIIQQPIHLVELDLLRGGRRHQFGRALPPGDFYAYVSRVEQRWDCQVYAWSLRDALPTIPIPLAAPDPDVLLDLQSVFTLTFERGRYQRWLRYDQPLTPPLSPGDESWMAAVLKG
ncbi:MAG: DUF4058 family protein [Planctomycetales bacterium]|nr:DUF4058 family protein [Planctomycetales bacterium]MCA9203100.1 DUF4058 family protein [Planctomycetales bacterium]MCA9226833.1 DUF4058 family protein [Planctomycetales bacterium]